MAVSLRRSIIFTPADDVDRLRESPETPADGIVFELEDMIAAEDKDAARENLREIVPELDFGATEVMVRMNSLKSSCWLDDLQTACAIDADTIVLPKADYPREVQTVSDVTAQLAPEMEIIIMLESPWSFFKGHELAARCRKLSNVTGCFYGEGDYCEHVNATHANDDLRPFLNNMIVSLAAIGDMDAIAAADLNFGDEAAQREYSEHCRDLGFVGQQALLPEQIEGINEVFTPSEAEYERARELVQTFESTSQGNIVVDGTMLDRPLVNRYRQMIAKYNAVHGIDEDLDFDYVSYGDE